MDEKLKLKVQIEDWFIIDEAAFSIYQGRIQDFVLGGQNWAGFLYNWSFSVF